MSRIQVRRGPASLWTSVNPTLGSGEFGLETDTGKVKLGDGTTAWTALAYFVGADLISLINAKYTKPGSGIPKTDLAASVQSTLDQADATHYADSWYGRVSGNRKLPDRRKSFVFSGDTASPSATDDTGQATTTLTATGGSGTGAAARILNGRWGNTAGGTGSVATYRGFAEPGPVTRIGARFSFDNEGGGTRTTQNGSMTLGIMNEAISSPVGASSSGRVGVHFVISPGQWTFSTINFATGFSDPLGQGYFSDLLRKDGVTQYEAEVYVSGNTATLVLPDGQIASITNANIGAWSGAFGFVECYSLVGGTDNLTWFHDYWADYGQQAIPTVTPHRAAATAFLSDQFSIREKTNPAKGIKFDLSLHTQVRSKQTLDKDEVLMGTGWFTSKGQLAVGTGDGTVALLNPGSTGQTLTVDPSTATGLKYATPTAGGGSSINKTMLQARMQIPDLNAAEYDLNTSVTGSYSNVSASTSIGSGITAADMASNMDSKVTYLGTKANQLETIVAGYKGPTWRQASNGQYNYEGGGPTTPWGSSFWVAGSRFAEILGGLGAAGAYLAYVDGRKLTRNAQAMSGAGSANNKIKFDFGSGNNNPHLLKLLFHSSFSLAKIFTEAGGVVYPASLTGLKAGFLTDSSGDVDTIIDGDHLDFYIPKFSSMAGFEDFYSDCVGGTGTGVGFGSFSSFISRATNSPIKDQGVDVLFISTGWGNDRIQGRTSTQVGTDTSTLLTTIAGWTKPPLVVFLGMYDPTGAGTGTYPSYETAAVAAAIGGGAAYISMLNGNVYTFGNSTPIANIGPLIIPANVSSMIWTDNLHPSAPVGQEHISRFALEGWRRIQNSYRILEAA